MEAVIKLIDGRWTVNGKQLSQMSMLEIGLLNSFFKVFKADTV